MTSRELEYIKTVADEKSISSAARKLYIAQPSLSQSLQRIEENLGAKLFNRTPSGLTLTYAGERCYQMACQVLKIYSDFEAEISDINQLKTGRIVMGTTNRRGLPGFGVEWNEAISGDYGGQCMKDYFTAIDEMAQEPFVDKDRLGCVGASFGGFSVYWLAGHHDKRFKAFIAHDGIFNMEMQYLETE